MGLTNLSYGLYGGVVAFAVPQLLGNRNVPETAIAGLTALAFSPSFYAFLISPILDVRFSRRWYAVALAIVASLTLVVAFLNLDHLVLLETVLTVGFFAAYLYQSAVGGWLSSITSAEEEKSLSVWVRGVGVAAGGIIGCLVFPLFSRLMPLRPFYLTVGIVGGLCTLGLILLPRTPPSFAILLITENLFQALAITTSTAVIFETIGRDNPLASTTFCFVGSAYGVPISYMLYVDAFGFSHGGITGSLAIDATTGILASVLLGMMLLWLSRRPKSPHGLTASASRTFALTVPPF
jgi:PAT family beta-lactamase induction signal transducer AmpG